MKSKKLNLENFSGNELSRSQKMTIMGKGDETAQSTSSSSGTVVITTTGILVTETPLIPGPGDGSTKGNGEGRFAR